MNCERFETITIDLARKQSRGPQRDIPTGMVTMDANERAQAQAHVDECDVCRKTLSDQLALSERLRAMANEMKSAVAPKHLEAQLLTAFREQARVRFIQPAKWRYWMSAAAAVFLVAFGLFAWNRHIVSVREFQALTNSNTTTVPRSEAPAQLPAVSVNGIESSPPALIKPAPGKLLTRRRPKSLQLAKSSEAQPSTTEPATVFARKAETKEVTTDFVPVGYGSALDLQEGGQLVRVELPRSALTRFGLPMNMDRANERIKADVLVGADGLARAIRFVDVKAINKD